MNVEGAELRRLLTIFTEYIVKFGDFSPAGVEISFQKFVDSLKVKEPAAAMPNPSAYTKTTLEEAIQKAKLPVYVPVFRNKWGHWESTICKGLLFSDEDARNAIAIGDQGDDGSIQPLTMNQLFVCQSNGWFYKKSNTTGSAAACSNTLGV